MIAIPLDQAVMSFNVASLPVSIGVLSLNLAVFFTAMLVVPLYARHPAQPGAATIEPGRGEV